MTSTFVPLAKHWPGRDVFQMRARPLAVIFLDKYFAITLIPIKFIFVTKSDSLVSKVNESPMIYVFICLIIRNENNGISIVAFINTQSINIYKNYSKRFLP